MEIGLVWDYDVERPASESEDFFFSYIELCFSDLLCYVVDAFPFSFFPFYSIHAEGINVVLFPLKLYSLGTIFIVLRASDNSSEPRR